MTEVYSINGEKNSNVDLPPVFNTPFRYDLIHKIYTIQNTHTFQPKGTHPTAGMDVSADSLDPPTGHGQSRVARINAGGAGGRGGQGGEVASTRGGRQAHPPNVEKVIHKKSNKKERALALRSAIAATASKERIIHRNHFVGDISQFPIIVQDEIESISKTSDLVALLKSFGISKDIDRLQHRKTRTGKAALRGRTKKTGASILFVAKNSKNLSHASSSIRGIEARDVANLSVLDLAPGGEPARFTIYSESAIADLGKIHSTHIEVMARIK
ncbi:MAG: ribosomal protein L4 [Cenarchaeum symbiont of Oopsacas minuta]|nr:ribosomal protein L4 [Cenarchaeum symbiont of Oopsacas minuta]